jgi:ABC-type phosphate transport system substrate-binding protein
MNVNWISPRRWVALTLAVAAIVVAGCGGGGSSSSASSSSSSPPAATSTSSGSSSSGIPQGPNAGDKDADNKGGPSDGDGNI